MLKDRLLLKSGTFLEQTAAERLYDLISSFVATEIWDPGTAKGPDFCVRLATPSGPTVLAVKVKARLWPNEVPSIVHNLLDYCRAKSEIPCMPLVFAPSISERAAEQCESLELSWADLAGNCHIRFGNVLIHIEGKRTESSVGRGTASLYTPKAARVVHALLLEPLQTWRVADLVDRTKVSLGQVSNVRKLLVQNAFAETGADGLRLTDPKSLLLDWAKNYRPHRATKRHYTLNRPKELENSLSEQLPSYALTEFSAADRYAPYTRYQGVAFYVDKWLHSNEAALDLRPAESSPNVTIYESVEGLLFSETRGGVTLASPLTTYLDLALLGGRGQDAAEHLFESVIRPRWR